MDVFGESLTFFDRQLLFLVQFGCSFPSKQGYWGSDFVHDVSSFFLYTWNKVAIGVKGNTGF